MLLFSEVNKISVHILVQCNTSLSKRLCCTFNNYSLCARLDFRTKSLCSVDVCAYRMKSVAEQGFLTNSHSTTRRLKHPSNFESAENGWSSNVVEFEFELRHIRSH